METLRSGIAARFDTFNGLVPCRVLSVAGESRPYASSSQRVRIRITRTGRGYRAGEIIGTSALRVVPVRSIRRRRYSNTIRVYAVQADGSVI